MRALLPVLLPLLLLGACGGGDVFVPAPQPPAPVGPVPGEDVRLDTDPPGSELSVVPQICCDGERVYVVWRDDRDGAYDVRMTWSGDAGSTWRADPVRLDADEAGVADSFEPEVCCSGVRARVVWMDERNGLGDIYANTADFTREAASPPSTSTRLR